MSFPGYAATQCEIAVVNAGTDLKLALDKAVEALPQNAAYNTARKALKQAEDDIKDATIDSISKIRFAIQHAKLNAPADQAKVYDDLEKSLNDLKNATLKQDLTTLLGVPAILSSFALVTIGLEKLLKD